MINQYTIKIQALAFVQIISLLRGTNACLCSTNR